MTEKAAVARMGMPSSRAPVSFRRVAATLRVGDRTDSRLTTDGDPQLAMIQ
ncbi:hypothetical protein [Natrialba taiwanensis]|uniref:hypothetical protein n=1 Tax=Natrialba taiwanensis TaxID=160846 RepID=UPI00135F11BA|nr:hypothetical protein [Natrialba taiwanensis]